MIHQSCATIPQGSLRSGITASRHSLTRRWSDQIPLRLRLGWAHQISSSPICVPPRHPTTNYPRSVSPSFITIHLLLRFLAILIYSRCCGRAQSTGAGLPTPHVLLIPHSSRVSQRRQPGRHHSLATYLSPLDRGHAPAVTTLWQLCCGDPPSPGFLRDRMMPPTTRHQTAMCPQEP
jgi:hypothetical protein